jgi:hypothetical protein
VAIATAEAAIAEEAVPEKKTVPRVQMAKSKRLLFDIIGW